ncbi:hypothetical protein BLD44_018150 [Mastigocladus laminosus UU774]|nr:hypothetical protein BLD44_018150 [Mastigocladus laminosus UU774]
MKGQGIGDWGSGIGDRGQGRQGRQGGQEGQGRQGRIYLIDSQRLPLSASPLSLPSPLSPIPFPRSPFPDPLSPIPFPRSLLVNSKAIMLLYSSAERGTANYDITRISDLATGTHSFRKFIA